VSCPGLFTSAGRVLPDVEVRLRRMDGRLTSAGEAGIVEVRSPAMASGYRNNPGLSSQHFQDGWYVTGDLGRLDKDAFLHILGRAVDVQDIDGTMVTPTEIEDVLCQLQDVRSAVVVRDLEADLTIAVVIAWPGRSIDIRECRLAVTNLFGDTIAASLVVVPADRVPLTEQGKPDRAAVKRMARGLRAA
jgi:fatty-acyl-CoA synthase